MKSILRTQLDSGNQTINLPTGEYRENTIIDRPCTISGNNTTLWNDNGPVLVVRSQGVTLKDLRVELTNVSGYESESAALLVRPDTIVQNVELYGGVADTKRFYMPRSVHLGEFRAERENSFKLCVYLPEPCELRVKSENFKLYSSQGSNGCLVLTIVTNPLRDRAMLYGEILVVSKYVRRIFVDGTATTEAPEAYEQTIYSYDDLPKPSPSEVFAISVQKVSAINHNTPPKTITLRRGERYPLQYSKLSIRLNFSTTQTLDLDPYVFLTDKGSHTSSNADMVFFGNARLPNGSVAILSNDTIALNLDAIPPYVHRVYLCYSIYKSQNDPYSKTFAMVNGLSLSICYGNFTLFRIPIDVTELAGYSTIVLAEFYRHDSHWKVNPIVSGFRGSLPQMCKSFGIDARY